MAYWAKPGLDRYETRLFTPTLDESVGDNHPVRHLDEILRGMDWSDWTAQYNGRVGQPPIPSWVMAGVILYGLMRRIRSSRQLEYACKNHIDFIWLAEGRTIDHDAICAFRTKFKKPLKALFKQVGRVAMTMGLIKLVAVAFDGTRDFIVDCNVIGGPNEQNGLLPSVGRIEENFGRKPETMAADAQEPLREKMHAKLRTEEGRKTYNQRMHVAETPFAIIKGIMEVRRFLLRGLEKVRTEWTWVCTAYNLKKLIAVLVALRAESDKTPAWSRS